ncbi:imm11 family protein [Burkholderia vietnamiensis]|uniref:imm11 family protein n=1 Tax=Burkholderia vietnamiensis TaxID=60552 RepID=UPI0012DA6F3D|nr:DUF1629 domain-containing protein [Burkholderia vietnamiensis]
MRLFDITVDSGIAYQRHLAAPFEIGGSELLGTVFKRGKKFEDQRGIGSRIASDGGRVAFSLGGRGTFFVDKRVVDTLNGVLKAGNVEFVPAHIEGVDEEFFVLNCFDIVDCVAEAKSNFGKWMGDDGRPDMIGRYRGISRMVLDSNRTAGHDMFRTRNWEVALICNEQVRDALLNAGITGIKFNPVEMS